MRDDIRLKLGRAAQHMKDLRLALMSFIESNPYEVAPKRNPQTRRMEYTVINAGSIPDEIALIAGDVLQNLRSALDYLAWRLVVVNGGTPGTQTSFPIFDDAAKYANGHGAKVHGMRQEAIAVIDRIKPYRGGDDMLWRLHRLNNIDKHRLLFTVGTAFRSLNLAPQISQMFTELNMPGLSEAQFPDLFVRPQDNLFPLKQGDVVFIDAPDAKPVPGMQFRFEVAINELGIAEGEPLLSILQNSFDSVDQTIKKFTHLL